MTKKSFGESGWGSRKKDNRTPPTHPSSNGSGSSASSSEMSTTQSSTPSDTGYSPPSQGSYETYSSSAQTSEPSSAQLSSKRETTGPQQEYAQNSRPTYSTIPSRRLLMRSPFATTLTPTYQPSTVTPLDTSTAPVEETVQNTGYMAPPDLSQTDRLLQQRQAPMPSRDPTSIPPSTIPSRQGPGSVSDSDWKKYQDRRDK